MATKKASADRRTTAVKPSAILDRLHSGRLVVITAVANDWHFCRCHYFGVYQIGEAQARSCNVAWPLSGNGRWRLTAKSVVQRGVGISSARAKKTAGLDPSNSRSCYTA